MRGKSFGFHRALDTLGAVVGLGGAALVVFLWQGGALSLSGDTFRMLVLIGVVPAVLAVIIIFFFVHDVKSQAKVEMPATEAKGFDTRFKFFLIIMLIFTLGNSSDAFLVLRAQDLGSSVLHILLMFILFNFIYATVSMPAGILSDRLGRKKIIVLGWLLYALSYLGFALATAWWQLWLLFALYGLYFGTTNGILRAFVADMVGRERRGTAYGLFHTAVGITAFPASLIAGLLWENINSSAPFFFGAALAGIAAIAFLALIKE
jgi:MFS-type transporter involved in bile tolerance (Atg22 family)